MFKTITFHKASIALALLVTALLSYQSYAQEKKTDLPSVQKHNMSERHKKLAQMHSKMATCLDSAKTTAQCRQEMMDSCSSNFAGYCPMMNMRHMGGPGHGMMYGTYMDWMMSPESDSHPTPPKIPSTKDNP